jgi:hypothetical protein
MPAPLLHERMRRPSVCAFAWVCARDAACDKCLRRGRGRHAWRGRRGVGRRGESRALTIACCSRALAQLRFPGNVPGKRLCFFLLTHQQCGMGKRKLHGQTYYQCDWTGLAMRSTNCYMPSWASSGLLKKGGSYANWECVVAHASDMFGKDEITLEYYSKIKQHVFEQCGAYVKPAPHYSTLHWFGGSLQGALELQAECERVDAASRKVVAVCIGEDGVVGEVLCDHGAELATPVMKRPQNTMGETRPTCLTLPRKRTSVEKDRNGLAFNHTASRVFKCAIYGDAVVVRQAREPSHIPRCRYLNFHISDYEDVFSNKRRRTENGGGGLTVDEFTQLKTQMTEELAFAESVVSSLAQRPEQMSSAASCLPASGKELARLVDPTGELRAGQRAKRDLLRQGP